jgi:2-oxoisovalerate dehydrogenase E1 component alpha subunit
MVVLYLPTTWSRRVFPLSLPYENCSTSFSVHFPGAVNSKFTSDLSFEHPSTYPAIPTYRAMSPDGDIISPTLTPPSDELSLSMYHNMLSVSIMDVIMFDSQRQGRLSFYLTSQGEEGTSVGSASALEKEDVIFSQYREAGMFMQRGFTFADFMSQLFSNTNDMGRGRNMPVHYGSKALNMVSFPVIILCPFKGLFLQTFSTPSLLP